MSATTNRMLRISGLIMIIVSCFMLPALVYSVAREESASVFAFICTIVIFTLAGVLLMLITKKRQGNIYTRDSIIILAMCWFLAAFIGAFPYLFSGVIKDPFDAFFESCSGFTTTGATVFTNVENLPEGILFWRSLTQWFGGIGIIVFSIAIIPSLFTDGTSITSLDKPGMALARSFNKNFQIIKNIFLIYIACTVVEIIILTFAGVDLFDSLICVLGTISSGGFSNHNAGTMVFTSPVVKVLLIFFMLMCGMSVSLVYSMARKGLSALRSNSENKLYLLIILISSVFCVLVLFSWKKSISVFDFINSAFQVVSVLSTTGASTCDYTLWPRFISTLLLVLMMIGGCSVSVASGNKVIRIAIIVKLLIHGIETRLHPNAVTPIKINSVDLQAETVNANINHIFLFCFAFFSGAFILSWENVSIAQCFTDSISLLCNVGISFDHAGFINNISNYHEVTKAALCLLMVAGRLELLNIIVLFTPSFWRAE